MNAAPFKPTSCSVERFVSSSDPAMNTAPSERPARKWLVVVATTVRRTVNQVPMATSPVKKANEAKVMRVCMCLMIGDLRSG